MSVNKVTKNLFYITVCLSLNGCVLIQKWGKEGATHQDYKHDSAICEADMERNGGSEKEGLQWLFYQCMTAHGWDMRPVGSGAPPRAAPNPQASAHYQKTLKAAEQYCKIQLPYVAAGSAEYNKCLYQEIQKSEK